MLRRILIIVCAWSCLHLQGMSETRVRHFLERWCEAHNQWELGKIRLLYAKRVLYYAHWVDLDALLRDKTKYFRPDDAFSMKIASGLRLSEFAENITKCEFTKEVRYKGKMNRYPAYLLLKDMGLDTEILAESDEISDRNAGFVLSPATFAAQGSSAGKDGNSGGWIYYAISFVLVLVIGGAFSYRWYVGRVERSRKVGEGVGGSGM